MNKRVPIIFGLILVMIAAWLLVSPTKTASSFLEHLDNLGYDLQLRTRFLNGKVDASPVVIIDIDDKSLKAEGHWPWPRSKLAELVTQLHTQGAAVIAFDIFFAEKQTNIAEQVSATLNQKKLAIPSVDALLKENSHLFDEDTIFAKSLVNNNAIVLAFTFLPKFQTENLLPPPLLNLTQKQQSELDVIDATGYIGNIPILQQAAKQAGFINIFADSDGILRRAPLIMEYKGGIYPSLALQAALLFLGQKLDLVTPIYNEHEKLEGITIGTQTIATDAKGQALIPFVGRSYTFPYYSATDVLHGKIPKDALLGKIILIGTSATGLGDLVPAAIQNPFPGVEIQASIINGILQNNFSYQPAWVFGINLMLTIMLGLIATFYFSHIGPRLLSFFIVITPPFLLFLNNWLWQYTGLLLSLIVPITLVLLIALFNLIYGYLFETRKREQLKSMFGQYVPEKHIDEMLKRGGHYALHGEDRNMTVLFADIRNFTMISEGLSAAELVEMLNTFFTPITEIIFKHRGTIDKYVGDLVMAFWGAPLKDHHHAYHAINCALEMQRKIKVLPIETNGAEIKMGIGINSGTMSVGDMGSRFRRNYTVLGDTVNLASRIENLTKFYDVEIIVAENTQRNQPDFIFRKLDRVKVKGKNTAVTIYEVLGKTKILSPELKESLELYHQALDFYFDQQWDEAERILLILKKSDPHKKLYHIYLDRIEEFKNRSVPKDWDGVYKHALK